MATVMMSSIRSPSYRKRMNWRGRRTSANRQCTRSYYISAISARTRGREAVIRRVVVTEIEAGPENPLWPQMRWNARFTNVNRVLLPVRLFKLRFKLVCQIQVVASSIKRETCDFVIFGMVPFIFFVLDKKLLHLRTLDCQGNSFEHWI